MEHYISFSVLGLIFIFPSSRSSMGALHCPARPITESGEGPTPMLTRALRRKFMVRTSTAKHTHGKNRKLKWT